MSGRAVRVLRTFALALLLMNAKAPLAVAQGHSQSSSSGTSTINAAAIQAHLLKFDPNFKNTRSPFSIDNGDLRLLVAPSSLNFLDGAPYGNPPQPALYGSPQTTEKFFGVELIIHYTLQRNGQPCGGLPIQERLTVLYENTRRFNPLRPQVLDTEPFIIKKDGTFIDRQVLGNYGEPFPATVLQILKQELILDSELIATVYIVRTPKEIRLVGYSVPPLVSGLEKTILFIDEVTSLSDISVSASKQKLSFGNLRKLSLIGSDGHYSLNGASLERVLGNSVELCDVDRTHRLRITFFKNFLVSSGKPLEGRNQADLSSWAKRIPLVKKILSDNDPIGSLEPLIYEPIEPIEKQGLELQEEVVLLWSQDQSETERIGNTVLLPPISFSAPIADPFANIGWDHSWDPFHACLSESRGPNLGALVSMRYAYCVRSFSAPRF